MISAVHGDESEGVSVAMTFVYSINNRTEFVVCKWTRTIARGGSASRTEFRGPRWNLKLVVSRKNDGPRMSCWPKTRRFSSFPLFSQCHFSKCLGFFFLSVCVLCSIGRGPPRINDVSWRLQYNTKARLGLDSIQGAIARKLAPSSTKWMFLSDRKVMSIRSTSPSTPSLWALRWNVFGPPSSPRIHFPLLWGCTKQYAYVFSRQKAGCSEDINFTCTVEQLQVEFALFPREGKSTFLARVSVEYLKNK